MDEYSRSTRVILLKHKDKSFDIFFNFCKRVQNETGVCITSIKSNHGGEFENNKFKLFYEENGILQKFSTPRTPQQNRVVERKKKSLLEMVRTMLNDNSTLKHF